MKTIVLALGGNALQKKDGGATAEAQRIVARNTAKTLLPLIADGNKIVIVHGNGPQVGNIVTKEESGSTPQAPTMPLDTCVAMSQGSIGYWLQTELYNALASAGMKKPVVSIVSQILVDPNDPAFSDPVKPIGPFYSSQEEAEEKANERGFVVKEDSGRGWRRVVPSPAPQDFIEIDTVKNLLDHGSIVITGGGGGIPVSETDGQLSGVEAVIDKDKTGSLIAQLLKADMFITLTSVPSVMINYGTDQQQAIDQANVLEMTNYITEGHFAAGSMLPKVEAAIDFTTATQKVAVIGDLDNIADIINGKSGTTIKP